MNRRFAGVAVAVMAGVFAAEAAEQMWNDAGVNTLWDLSTLNWDTDAAWQNGNTAVFSGGGGTVEVDAAITIAGLSFQTNGYTIADADNNGSLSLAGAPSLFNVAGSATTGTVSEALAGTGGLTKTGAGVLALTGTNDYSGVTTVSEGVLRLAPDRPTALGKSGTDNNTVVSAGATLDFNGCYAINTSQERFTIAGAGVDGQGALVNRGTGHTNKNIPEIILSDHATIGGPGRIDVALLTGNNKTLTKTGAHQICMRDLTAAEIVINEGLFTLLDNNNALGGTTWGDTTVNGGRLDCWNTRSYSERITFNGGSLSQGNVGHTFTLAGHLTVNSNVAARSASGRGVVLSGFIDGPGGFTQDDAGWLIITGNTNTYTGPTVINSGRSLWVGTTNIYSGVLGFGTATNSGALYGYSPMITRGNIVNAGNLFVCTGLLTEAGSVVVNNNNLYIDRGGAFTVSNAFAGTGLIYVRSNAHVTVSGGYSTNSQLRIGYGGFSLTNGASFRFTGELQIADRLGLGYVIDPTNVTAVMDIAADCTLLAQAITFGNGTNVGNGGMTSVVNHAGTVITTGRAAEDNGIRLGHYPLAYSVYNMLGGTLVVGADWDLCCATDGVGWFNMTGGEAFAKRVMLNERHNTGGYGRLTLSGGVLNVGSLTGSELSLSNGIAADVTAPYLVELGGAGGVIRAVTNIEISVNNTLHGAGAEAVTFDTQAWTINITSNMTGAGGFNKAGTGTLALTGSNTYGGPARVLEGRLVRGAPEALPQGGEVLLRVTAADDGGRLHSDGDLSLAGITVGVANPGELDKQKSYTVATYGGALTQSVTAHALPEPWYVYHDSANKRVQIKANIGTVIWLR